MKRKKKEKKKEKKKKRKQCMHADGRPAIAKYQ
jgi:hypothetical protein